MAVDFGATLAQSGDMDDTDSQRPSEPRGSSSKFTPRAGVRPQLYGAAAMWAVGASILIVRGFGYLTDRYWHAWALAAALAIGVIKSRYLLDRVARKAVDRIRARGHACFFGFFSVKAWAFVGLMMGMGMLLRRLVVQPDMIGAGIMGAIYIGVGMALALADRIFWKAALSPVAPVSPRD